MTKLDLERLQEEWSSPFYIQRSGRTTRMLISAVQNVMTGDDVIIIAHSYNYCKQLVNQTISLALEMCYKVSRPEELYIKIDNISLRFL